MMSSLSAGPNIHPARSAARRRSMIVLGWLILSTIIALLVSCMVGSVPLSFADLQAASQSMIAGGDASLASTVFGLRLARGASAFVTGAMLALAGVMMQALLRNPLADPYVLGVSGGAAVGALAAMLFFSAAWMIDVAAFAGAVTVALLLFALTHHDLRSGGSRVDGSLLLLSGVVVASGCGALITLMLSIAPDSRLRGMVFWLIGDLSGSSLGWLPWIVLGAAMLFSIRTAPSINVMAMHAEAALTLGVSVGRLRRGLFFCAALGGGAGAVLCVGGGGRAPPPPPPPPAASALSD
jgi:iron complex transport system permease protein